jgi:hypothetical protein
MGGAPRTIEAARRGFHQTAIADPREAVFAIADEARNKRLRLLGTFGLGGSEMSEAGMKS